MKIQSLRGTLIAMVFTPAILAVVLASSYERHATASNSDHWITGMFALAHGQTVRITAICLPPGPCHLEMMFVDGLGNVVSLAKSQELRSGQVAFFDHQFEIPTMDRITLRAVVFARNESGKSKGNDVLLNGEVFDNDTGKTAFTQTFEDCD